MYNPLKPQTAVPGDDDEDDEEESASMDPYLKRQFFLLVAVINLGVLGVALGAMFVAFRGQWGLGAVFGLPGAALLAYAAREYRKVQQYISSRADNDHDE